MVIKYRNTKNDINFILANKIDTLRDVNVLNIFRTGSDHRIIRAKIIINTNLGRIKLVKIANAKDVLKYKPSKRIS